MISPTNRPADCKLEFRLISEAFSDLLRRSVKYVEESDVILDRVVFRFGLHQQIRRKKPVDGVDFFGFGQSLGLGLFGAQSLAIGPVRKAGTDRRRRNQHEREGSDRNQRSPVLTGELAKAVTSARRASLDRLIREIALNVPRKPFAVS